MTTSSLVSNAVLKSEKSSQLRRVIWTSPDAPIVYWMDVTGTMPRGSRMPKMVGKAAFVKEFESSWTVSPNTLPTKEMNLPESELSAATVEIRDRNWMVIEPLVGTEEALLKTLNKQTRPTVIAAAAASAKVPVSRVYQLLTQFFWFGNGKFSLTPRLSARGALKASKDANAQPKRGRPNSVTVREGPTIYQGRNVTQSDLNRFATALEDYWVDGLQSLAATYSAMKDKLYVSSNQHSAQKLKAHKVSNHFIPTLRQFRYHAKFIIAERGLWEKRIGRQDWSQYVMSRTGSAADIAIGPTDIYDMDVVELKCIAVTDSDPPEPMGKVNACIAVDRASRAIAGFHFFQGAERWDHYRIALFRAFTSTRKHLEDLRIFDLAERAPDFAADAWCNSVYADRGPARGLDAFYALVDGLRLERALAPGN
jgi:hypothetical protein